MIDYTKLNHEVELIFAVRQESLKKVSTIVLSEKLQRPKKVKETRDKVQQMNYLKKWKADNEVYLNTVFGMADGPQFMFLTGVLFALSSSKHLVLLLQDVI